MKTGIKISAIAIATLFIQSCNMSKHYGNMRIGHNDLEKNADAKNTFPLQLQTNSTENTSPATTDSIIEITSIPTDHNKQVATGFEEKPDAKINTPIHAIKKGNTLNRTSKKNYRIRKYIQKVTKKIKIQIPGSAQNEMGVDEWGYIAIGLTVLAFIVLIIITGSFISALVLAAAIFSALMSIIAAGLILYAFWAILNFLSGGF